MPERTTGRAYVDKPVLRSTLKKLRALPLDRTNHPNLMMAPQEMLDFLAMRAGLKPVHLLGRGFDDRDWIDGALAMARKAGLHVIEGPMWNAKPPEEAFPTWYRDHLKATEPVGNVHYICHTKGTAEAVEKSFANPPISMDDEARLLGYPPCCVRAHYDRTSLLDQTFYKMLERTGAGIVEECNGSFGRTQD